MNGYFINLKNRVDRLIHFEDDIINKYDIFSKVQRFEAIPHSNGAVGCYLSHINSLELLIQSNDDMFIVFEDDFFILNETNFKSFLKDFEIIKESNEWDIIVLTPSGDKIDEESYMTNNNFKRINNNQTATGYIIKKPFAKVLLEHFKYGISFLEKGNDPNKYALDQYWKILQSQYKFYYYRHIFAGQLPGYSSIENRLVDYNERFVNQQ